MQVRFWGTRGSLPTSITSSINEAKIFKAIRMSQSFALATDDDIRAFVREKLPFSVRQSYGGNTSCVEIDAGKEFLLCDAGTGLRDFGYQVMKARADGADLPKDFHIFISHLHWDHIQGFPFFTPAFLPGSRIHLYGCHAELEQAFVCQQMEPYFPIPLSAMKADISFRVLKPGEVYDIAGAKVSAARQNHPGDSYGYRFLIGGKTVGYSTDAEHKKEAQDDHYRFLDFFNRADLLIFDAQYDFLDSVDAKENWGHSSNLLGVELALRAGVRRLCLFHHEHTLHDEALDRFLEDTRRYLAIFEKSSTMEVCLAYDGLVMEI
jgi:phosphoribosyl 1,2-cyclic phosphodiesterase